MMTISSKTFSIRITPSTAWCFVWLPTLFYFLYTRYPSASVGSGSRDSEASADRFQLFTDKDCQTIVQTILFSATACPKEITKPIPKDEESTLSSNVTINNPTRLVLQQALQLLWNADASGMTTTTTTSRTYAEKRPKQIYLVDSTWYQDTDTGRGAILVSQASGHGRVWRWETGGGPIPIGRTLVLDHAGCRSSTCTERAMQSQTRATTNPTNKGSSSSPPPSSIMYTGVGGLASIPDNLKYPQHHENAGKIVLAEWGEGRIVRLEQETGARTPLILQVPMAPEESMATTPSTACVVNNSSTTDGDENTANQSTHPPPPSLPAATVQYRRIRAPTHLHVTSEGDLFFLEKAQICTPFSSLNAVDPDDCDSQSGDTDGRMMVLWQQRHVHKIPSLDSLPSSRRAHEWTVLPYETNVQQVFAAKAIGSFAVVEELHSTSVFVTASIPVVGMVILKISLHDEDDTDDEQQNESYSSVQPHIVFRLSRYLPTAIQPGPLVVTSKAIFLATNEGIAILLPNQNPKMKSDDEAYRLAGLLPLPIMDRPTVTSMTLGLDSYLYVTTESRLWRIKVRV